MQTYFPLVAIDKYANLSEAGILRFLKILFIRKHDKYFPLTELRLG